MDWQDPTMVCNKLQALYTLSDEDDSPDPDIKLPHEVFGFPADDITLRALAGFILIKRQSDDATTLLPHLEAMLHSDKLAPNIRAFIHDEIAEIERQQRTTALATLKNLSNSDQYKPTIDDTETETTDISVQWYQEEEDEQCHIRFGYELKYVRATLSTIAVNAEMATLLETFTRAIHIWQDRLSLSLNMTLTWRYMSEDNHVCVAALVDVYAPEKLLAKEAATGLQTTFQYHLPLPHIYTFEPITDLERLQTISQDNNFLSAAEIMRGEVTAEQKNRTLYAVRPIHVDRDRLHSLMRYLRDSKGVQVVDITVCPTVITPDEVNTAMAMVTHGFDHLDHDTYPVRLESSHADEGDERWQEMLDAYRSMLAHLRQQAYQVRIRVACMYNTDILPLATVAGRALLGLSTFEIIPATYGTVPVRLSDLKPSTLAPSALTRLRQLWSVVETATAIRLPHTTNAGVPGIPLSKLKLTPIPSDLPRQGCQLGQAVTGERLQPPIYIPYSDRTRHVYVVGRTGTGKTTMLHNMALQDIENGHGVGVIDPHGDLIDALLERIPPERAGDVVLFDPGDTTRPIGLNLLDVDGIVAQNLAVSDFIGLMYSMYDPQKTGIVGPRFEQSVRNSMYTAMALPDATIIDVLRIIGDRKYSKAARKYLKDEVIKDYWETIYSDQSDFHKSEVKDYITSKFSRFTSDRMVRQIIGQPKTSLDFADIFDSQKILLVNLAKGRIGEFNSQFLGFILVSQLLIAAFQRVERPQSQRTPFYLYLDEFQNFATPGLASMLSEGRKYGLALTLAHQFTHQLNTEMREAVFGNVGTICAFQVGVQDATYLSREMYPVFETDDLVNLPAYHVALKMLSGGRMPRPFTLKTLSERRLPSVETAKVIRHFSRLTYGRNSTVVADHIRNQFQRSLDERVTG